MSRYPEKNSSICTLWAEIDLGAVRHNLRVLCRAARRSPKGVLAVVKAGAYGHGMKPVAQALSDEGVRAFGVANISEAVELREACPSVLILVLGSFHASQLADYLKHRIRPTVSSEEDVRVLSRFLARTKSELSVHVKVDTGMGRLGVRHEDAAALFKKISTDPRIHIEGIYTHFSSADKSGPVTREQLARFNRSLREARGLGLRPRYVHAANSAGLLRFKEAHLDLVRPGLALYGVCPAGERLVPRVWARQLRPALALKARISFIKTLSKGSPVSYGGTYVTPRTTSVATLPVGYSHGYRVGFSNRAQVLIRGRRCPVIGRVTMDQTLVELGRMPVKRWEEVLLIGASGRHCIRVEELALFTGTIPYEILCGIHSRIPRIYKGLNK